MGRREFVQRRINDLQFLPGQQDLLGRRRVVGKRRKRRLRIIDKRQDALTAIVVDRQVGRRAKQIGMTIGYGCAGARRPEREKCFLGQIRSRLRRRHAPAQEAGQLLAVSPEKILDIKRHGPGLIPSIAWCSRNPGPALPNG